MLIQENCYTSFFQHTNTWKKANTTQHEWVAVETRESSAASALWVEDRGQQESKLCYRARHAGHGHRPRYFCVSRFCLMWLLLLHGSALTMKTVHDVIMWYRKAQNGLLFIMTFSSLTQILSRITLRWHFFFQITKEISVLNGKTCLFYCTADTE